jgi:hypothetical protein
MQAGLCLKRWPERAFPDEIKVKWQTSPLEMRTSVKQHIHGLHGVQPPYPNEHATVHGNTQASSGDPLISRAEQCGIHALGPDMQFFPRSAQRLYFIFQIMTNGEQGIRILQHFENAAAPAPFLWQHEHV